MSTGIFIETKCSILSFEEPDLVRSVSKPETEMTMTDILENAEGVRRLVQGRKYYLMIVTEESAQYDKDAREYKDEQLESLKKGEAIIVRSLAHRILATYYARTRRKHHPIRVFGTIWEAEEWINSLREREQR